MIKSNHSRRALSIKQKAFIYGTLLGDGCIKKPAYCKNAYLSICQSHKEYVKFQWGIMRHFINMDIKSYPDKRKNRLATYSFRSICHPVITKIYKEIYIKKKKTITTKWLKYLTPFSLAIWYMDDGSMTKTTHQMRISTESFGFSEHLLIKNFLERKFKINARIKKSPKKGKYILSFKAAERNKFFKLIEPYILKEMKYKILNNTWQQWNWKKWQSSEIELLKNSYFGHSTNWVRLIGFLDRSKGSIMRKASYLKLEV